MSKKGYHTLILVTYKFSKKVTLIKNKDTFPAKRSAYAFLARLSLIDWSLLRELITNKNPKFFSKFWTSLFEKLGVKLLYSTAYYLQINGSNKRTNQMVEIVLYFFVHAFKDPSQ